MLLVYIFLLAFLLLSFRDFRGWFHTKHYLRDFSYIQSYPGLSTGSRNDAKRAKGLRWLDRKVNLEESNAINGTRDFNGYSTWRFLPTFRREPVSIDSPWSADWTFSSMTNWWSARQQIGKLWEWALVIIKMGHLVIGVVWLNEGGRQHFFDWMGTLYKVSYYKQ